MPLFREYEHTRCLLHAMFAIASRQEVKIVEFYSSEGASKLPSAMQEAFRLNSMAPEEFKQDWVRAYGAMYLKSVASFKQQGSRSVFDLYLLMEDLLTPQIGYAAPSTTEPFSLSGQDAQGNSQGGQAEARMVEVAR